MSELSDRAKAARITLRAISIDQPSDVRAAVDELGDLIVHNAEKIDEMDARIIELEGLADKLRKRLAELEPGNA